MNGAKGKGYVTSVLNTDAGQSAFVRSCNLIGDLMPLYNAARALAAAAPPRSTASTTSQRSSAALRCGTTSGSGGGTRLR